MQPYAPPEQAGIYIHPAPAAGGRMADAPRYSFAGRELAILALALTGILLLVLSAVSPWFQFAAVTEGRDGNSYTVIFQEGLLPAYSSELEGRVGLSIFIVLLAAILCAVVFLGLSRWQARNNWSANPAFILFVGLVPLLLCFLAPLIYCQYMPEAKMEVARGYHAAYQDTFDIPAGPSPENSLFGSGDHVSYFHTQLSWPHEIESDRASWGGSVGFYLCIAAAFVFFAAHVLAAANTWRAIKERALAGRQAASIT